MSLLRQRRLRNVQLALTFRCNHNCDMCSSNLLVEHDKKELELEQWKGVINELQELGCTHFDLTGGEPTMKGLEWLCSFAKHINRNNNCIISLATNAVLLDERWLSELYDSGLKTIEFNIQPGEHDNIVHDKGNLAHIKRLIPIAKEMGLNVCINTCLGSYNIQEFEELAEWCERNNLHILTNLAAPTGKMTRKDVRITEFKHAYYNLMSKYRTMRSDTTYNYFGWNQCPGGREKLYITSYGDVMQCTFVQISFGNVLYEPLKVIYKRFGRHPLIRRKYICKHTFWPEFREKWVNPIINREDIPVPLIDHPNYRLYKEELELTCPQ
ncbi:radical SAM/SPASM domain-containing protein [Chloroflexota bacterium]